MGEAILNISVSVVEGVCVISPAGDIDAHTAPLFKEAIEKQINSGAENIVFDFSSLNYISSAGIGILNAALNSLKGKGGRMAIAGAPPAILDTLEIMYFTRKVPALKDLKSAVAQVKAG